MLFTIGKYYKDLILVEPILMENPAYAMNVWNDNWTVETVDGSLSAQFEHVSLFL